ncbi:MAG: zinc-binding dehydrogenase [Phycisphaeraceae bacterium]
MRAMVAREYGDADVFVPADVPEPEVGEHDLLVEVAASSVNPVDCKVRLDGMRGLRPPPLVLGFDVCGIVREVGAAVDAFKPGDQVMASPSLARPGANAALVAVDARTAAHKPGNIDHAEAAALPLVTITAWQSLHARARLHPNETVLIQAGGGGVGHIAIQLARIAGARIIATASRPESIELCQRLGADDVINYAEQDVVERVRELTGGEGCPVVMDNVGGHVFTQSLNCLAVHGRLVTILAPPRDAPIAEHFVRDVTIAMEFMGATTVFGTRPEAQGQILETVKELVEVGRVTPHVSHRFTLDQLADAHRQQETRHTLGKIAVTVA